MLLSIGEMLFTGMSAIHSALHTDKLNALHSYMGPEDNDLTSLLSSQVILCLLVRGQRSLLLLCSTSRLS